MEKHGRVEPIAVADIVYIEGAGTDSKLVLADGRRELHDKTLEKLADVLPAGFERVHKSFLARLADIAALHASGGSHCEAELRGGLRIPVGRTRYKELRAWLL